MSWENIDKTRPESAHYSIMRLARDGNAMSALREMFPNAQADELNAVLFSTSGVHGTYCTIEACEAGDVRDVTFVIVHPRLVALRYGNCEPKTPDDFAFLKKLRATSHAALATIGAPTTQENP